MNRLATYLTAVLVGILMVQGVFAQNPGSLQENMLLSAVNQYNEGDYEASRASLNHIISQNPDSDAAWYYLALISFAEKDLETAEVCLKKAVELDGQNFWYRYRLAAIYAVTSRNELTVDMYEKLLRDFPKKHDLYFDLAEMYSAQGEFDKALETLDEIEAVFGVTESLAVYRFNLLRRMNRMEEAYVSLEEYNKRYSSPYILATLADYQISMYNDSTALAYYNEALDIAPDFSPALLGKAETLRMTRRYDEYFETLRAYILSPESSVEGKCDYMMAVAQRTDPKFLRTFTPQLDTSMIRLLSMHPNDSLALQTVGVYFYNTARDDKAKICFRKNVILHPQSLSASATYVEFLMYTDMWEELSMAGREAFKRFPKETAFLEMASVGDYNLQDYDKVLESCQTILKVAPSDSSKTLRAWSTMGDVYHEIGEPKKAYKAYEKALKVNPDYVYVLNNYAYYLSMEGKKLKKALDMSSRAVKADSDNATYLDTYGWILHLMGRSDEAKKQFKLAMLNGGKDSAVILDHYAEVLFVLKEYDMAFIYWNLAKQKDAGDVPCLDEKIILRKQEAGR